MTKENGNVVEEVKAEQNASVKTENVSQIMKAIEATEALAAMDGMERGRRGKEAAAETAGTPYQQMFAVELYTGMRPNEYYTAKVEGDFIVANNSKRKNGKTELKKIPISRCLRPMLRTAMS